MNPDLLTFSAKDAKAHFGEVLDEALGRPVAITRREKVAAYLISKRDYEAILNQLEELEDQVWLLKAEKARQEGFASDEEVKALLQKYETKNETKLHKAIA